MARDTTAEPIVEAAGGVVERRRRGAVEVLIVHRPKYDDWSFPKGKREPGEAMRECALREVEEETGLRCALGRELLGTEYVDRHGRAKCVRYWVMWADAGGFSPNDEVDEIRWLPPEQAARLLSYPRDVDLLESFTHHEDGDV